jgi:hypothetical protein
LAFREVFRHSNRKVHTDDTDPGRHKKGAPTGHLDERLDELARVKRPGRAVAGFTQLCMSSGVSEVELALVVLAAVELALVVLTAVELALVVLTAVELALVVLTAVELALVVSAAVAQPLMALATVAQTSMAAVALVALAQALAAVAQPLTPTPTSMAAVGTAEPYAIKATEPMAMRAPAIMRQSDRAVKCILASSRLRRAIPSCVAFGVPTTGGPRRPLK